MSKKLDPVFGEKILPKNSNWSFAFSVLKKTTVRIRGLSESPIALSVMTAEQVDRFCEGYCVPGIGSPMYRPRHLLEIELNPGKYEVLLINPNKKSSSLIMYSVTENKSS